MKIVVQKYGGSSVSNVEKIKLIAQKVVATKKEGYGVVVVVSAMGNTTDDLLKMVKSVSPDPPRREIDMLLSVGERICMTLLSTAIAELGEKAISLTGSQCGIITNDVHNNARIIDVRPFRVQDELTKGNIVIVAGYQGTSYKREITTLGRGGSDTTAVALAAALGAAHCDIYSDVAGIYTADPNVVPNARLLENISHIEMQELSKMGARVLNQQAVEFARSNKIAIYARQSLGNGNGTKIHRIDGTIEHALHILGSHGVVGVAGRKKMMLISFDTLPSGANRTGALLRLLNGYEMVAAVSFPRVNRTDIVISLENVTDTAAVGAKVRKTFPGTVTVSTRLGTAAVVGLGVGCSPAAMIAVHETMHKHNIALHMSFSARESISVVIPERKVEDTMRALHETFLENKIVSEKSRNCSN